jgi:hypothetical protein
VSENTCNMALGFVADEKLREIVAQYHRSAHIAMDDGAFIGAIVACGGICEGVLTWALLSKGVTRVSRRGKVVPIEEAYLPELIDTAKQNELLVSNAAQAAWALKEFRNLVHPYNLVRSGSSTRADMSVAMASVGGMHESVRSLRDRFSTRETQRIEPAVTTHRELTKVMSFSWLEASLVAGCRGTSH